MLKRTLIVAAAVLLYAGCNSKEGIDPSVEKLGRATGPVDAPHQNVNRANAPAPQKNQAVYQGKIEETIDVKNYTYLRLKVSDNKEIWAAVVKGAYEVGQQITLEQSIVMNNFRSPSLNRTFESIIFGSIAGNGTPSGQDSGTAVKPTEGTTSPSELLPPDHPPIKGMLNKTLPEGHPSIQKDTDSSPN